MAPQDHYATPRHVWAVGGAGAHGPGITDTDVIELGTRVTYAIEDENGPFANNADEVMYRARDAVAVYSLEARRWVYRVA